MILTENEIEAIKLILTYPSDWWSQASSNEIYHMLTNEKDMVMEVEDFKSFMKKYRKFGIGEGSD